MSGRRMEVGGTDVPAALLAAVRNYLDSQTVGRAAVLAFWALKSLGTRLSNEHVEEVLREIADLLGK